MHLRRVFCCFLSIMLLMGCVSVMPVSRAQALDYSVIEGKLSKWQYYFCRTLMSVALKDSYDAHAETGKNIFPSITCGQACFEGGICGAPISVIGKNHFAVRAYSYFPGKVYDDDELVVYDSYSDALNIKGAEYMDDNGFWRAYDTWEECVYDHTQMLLTQEKYADFVNASNYEEAAQAYQDSKYKGAESNYKANLLKRVEGYGFVQLDSVTKDSHGIFGLIMSESNVLIDSGTEYKLSAYSYPATSYDCTDEIVWTSSEPDVATVSQDGTVTALSTGYTLITADFGDKEAACVVCVNCNGYVMYGNYALYSQPDADSNSLGKLLKGQPIHLDGTDKFVSEDGTEYYAATARVSNGKLVSGYVQAKRVYVNTPSRLSVSTPFTFIQIDPGEEIDVPLTVHAEEMSGREITWESTNTDVATVSQEGHLAGVSEGVAVLYVYADGILALTVPVFVGNPEPQRLYTVKANDLRMRPVTDKTDNEYGTIRVGTYAWLLSVPLKGWYRVLTYVDGRYYDGYVKTGYFREDDGSGDDPFFGPSGDPSSSSGGGDQSSSPSGDPHSSESGNGSSETGASEDSTQSGETHTVSVVYRTGEVIADDWLNVHTEPSTSSEKIARLPSKTPVLILAAVENAEEPVFKSWYHVTAEHGGQPCEGFVAADYVQFTGTTEVVIRDDSSGTVRYGVDDLYVTGIRPGTSVAALSEGLERTIELLRDDAVLEDSKTVCTGDTVLFYIGSIPVYSRVAVVIGDVDGNGYIGAADYAQLKRHVLGTRPLEGAAFAAGRVTGKAVVSAADYLLIKRVVLGTYQLP